MEKQKHLKLLILQMWMENQKHLKKNLQFRLEKSLLQKTKKSSKKTIKTDAKLLNDATVAKGNEKNNI